MNFLVETQFIQTRKYFVQLQLVNEKVHASELPVSYAFLTLFSRFSYAFLTHFLRFFLRFFLPFSYLFLTLFLPFSYLFLTFFLRFSTFFQKYDMSEGGREVFGKIFRFF